MTVKINLYQFSIGDQFDYIARDDNQDGEPCQVTGWGSTPEEALLNYLDAVVEDEEVTDDLFNRVLALAKREVDYGRC